jgi:hypothetical protein
MRGPPQRAPIPSQARFGEQIRCSDHPLLTHLGSELRKLYAPLLPVELPAAFTELLVKLDGGEKEALPVLRLVEQQSVKRESLDGPGEGIGQGGLLRPARGPGPWL